VKKRLVLFLFLSAYCSACRPSVKQPTSHAAPATVSKVKQETELNVVVLTPEAEQRLGIMTARVELKPVSRVRTFGGEVTLPPGASLVITSPVNGRVEEIGERGALAAGKLVEAGQPILRLVPLLSPERDVLTPAERISMAQAQNSILTTRIDAAGQVAQAREQVNAARITLERAERLLRESAGTAKTVDDAKAQLAIALAAQTAAQARQKAADSISLEGSEAGTQTPLVITAPQSGMLRTHSVAPGEVVSAGATLFEVLKYDTVWIRVPVYAGELGQLAVDQSAEVMPLGARPEQKGFRATPIAAPPTATLLAATVDLYYEMPNPEGRFRPGERTTVKIRLPEAAEQLLVPWSSVMHDIHGGTWVFEKTADHTYASRRVQVRHVQDDLAVLASGPRAGANIVTAGAVELWGTELGFSK
jgi:RND family efflux transporter MFP subunit